VDQHDVVRKVDREIDRESETIVTNSTTLCSWWVNDGFQDRTCVQRRSTTVTAIYCQPYQLHGWINIVVMCIGWCILKSVGDR